MLVAGGSLSGFCVIQLRGEKYVGCEQRINQTAKRACSHTNVATATSASFKWSCEQKYTLFTGCLKLRLIVLNHYSFLSAHAQIIYQL